MFDCAPVEIRPEQSVFNIFFDGVKVGEELLGLLVFALEGPFRNVQQLSVPYPVQYLHLGVIYHSHKSSLSLSFRYNLLNSLHLFFEFVSILSV